MSSARAAAGRAAGVLLAGAALTLIALTFNAVPLLVPGLGFMFLGVAAPAWVWLSARPVVLERRLRADRVIEREPLEAFVDVRRGRIGLPGAELHDSLCQQPVALTSTLSVIRGTRTAQVRIVARFSRRGLRRLPPPALVVHDPLGLTLLVRSMGDPQEVLVLPYTEPVRWVQGDGGSRQRHGSRQSEPLAAVEVDGLRPYRLGTPASRIHWPALARGAGLLERRLRQDGDSRPLVVLDPRGGSEEQLDAAVRAAASLTRELARRGGCRLLLPGERRPATIEPDLVAWPGAHARLALVEGGRAARPPAVEASGRMAAVFYVAARTMAQLPAILSVPGSAPAILVLPRELAGPTGGRAAFEVAGCRGYLVGARVRQAA